MKILGEFGTPRHEMGSKFGVPFPKLVFSRVGVFKIDVFSSPSSRSREVGTCFGFSLEASSRMKRGKIAMTIWTVSKRPEGKSRRTGVKIATIWAKNGVKKRKKGLAFFFFLFLGGVDGFGKDGKMDGGDPRAAEGSDAFVGCRAGGCDVVEQENRLVFEVLCPANGEGIFDVFKPLSSW